LSLAPLLFAILGIVALTNFYNFMDGADGLAAGQGLLTLAAAGAIAMNGGDQELALIAALLAAALAGFLMHNWPPAAIFMGDAGSTFLGFLFGSLAASAAFDSTFTAVPAAAWPCLLATFLADTTFTLLRRIWRGEPWRRAHREHYYQRLIRGGWSHGRVAAAYLAVSAILGVLAVGHFALGAGTPAALLVCAFLVLAGAFQLTRRGISGQRPSPARGRPLPAPEVGHWQR
jgi:Fuc2NAc and GlcNAc transferase